MIRRPPRSTRTDTPFPTRRSSDLFYFVALVLLRHLRDNVGHPNFKVNQRHCAMRSEEHTSELQSLMRISYAVFCLKKKKTQQRYPEQQPTLEINRIRNTRPQDKT